MSSFIHVSLAATSGAPLQIGYGQNDDGIQPADYRFTFPQSREGRTQDVDVLWTRNSLLGAGGGDGIRSGPGGIIQSDSQRWEYNFPPTGCHVRKVVSGVVLDSNSNPVAGATVQLYNTATGLLVDTQTSAAGGTYRCGDPNNVNCFAVGYLSGSPDTAGTTIDTITGT